MKKLFALTLALMMVLSLAMTASAVTITVDDKAGISTYKAYKLLNAVSSVETIPPAEEDGEATKKVHVTYSLNNTYKTILQTLSGETTEDDILAYIADQDARTFAEAVYAQVKDMTPEYNTANNGAGTAKNIFKNVDKGYYLIVETSVADHPDTYSLVMLDTAAEDTVTITTKEGAPTVEKKVKDKYDSTDTEYGDWQDSADHDIGDHIPYQLTGTLSSKYDDYETYYYQFVDTMTNLKLDTGSVKVYLKDTQGARYEVTAGFEVTGEGTSAMTVTFVDLKSVTADGGHKAANGWSVVVEYTAELLDSANLGNTGNPNTVYLKYNNNPYFNEDEDHDEIPDVPENPGETPEDIVVVFTYKVVVDKVDGTDGGDPENYPSLKGAGFTLYKVKSDAPTYTVLEEVGSFLATENKSTFSFEGLDDGFYKLVEDTAPDGYNKIEPIIFQVTAAHETENVTAADVAAKRVLTDLNGNAVEGAIEITWAESDTDQPLKTQVVNMSGTVLPSTGGVGTTMFYIIGSVLVLGAGILLISKKRMSAM